MIESVHLYVPLLWLPNGAKALAYVRARYVDPTADLGRMKRQQAFLERLIFPFIAYDALTGHCK